MPFCTNCGSSVDQQAFYCRHCGAAQNPSASGRSYPPPPPYQFLHGIKDRTACILCYIPVFGIIPAIICLMAHRFRNNYRVRFNAFQGLYLFVAWLIVSSAIPNLLWSFPGHGVEHAILDMIRLALIFCWIFMLVKTAQQQQVSLPIFGDLAARSAQEQL